MKLRILFGIVCSTSLLLGGCASTANTAAQDNTKYVPVVNAASQKVVTQYVPVPVPGQLMPMPNAANSPTPPQQTATAAVDAANQQATQVPNSSEFFNSMMTYNFMPGALYTVYTAPMRITDISLAPGEKLISEAAGDTLRWQIAQTYSGSGDSLTQHILVKPNQPDLQNTVIITTDQRVYHLILQSTNSSYMASVQWNYPGDMVTYQNNTPGVMDPTSADSSPDVDLNNLDFSYNVSLMKGSFRPAWFPTRIFNDGKQTYIQLPPNYSVSQLPVLFVADENGNYASMVNWRYRAPYIVVDVVIDKARLQSGVDSTGQTIVQISHQ